MVQLIRLRAISDIPRHNSFVKAIKMCTPLTTSKTSKFFPCYDFLIVFALTLYFTIYYRTFLATPESAKFQSAYTRFQRLFHMSKDEKLVNCKSLCGSGCQKILLYHNSIKKQDILVH